MRSRRDCFHARFLLCSFALYYGAFAFAPLRLGLALRPPLPVPPLSPLSTVSPFSSSSLSSSSLLLAHPPSSLPLCSSSAAIHAVLAVSACLGARLSSTEVGKKILSPPIAAMALAFFLSNVGVLPSGPSPAVTSLQSFAVRTATPLLLFGADLRRVWRSTGSMLPAFSIGAAGTACGALAGAAALRLAFPTSGGLEGDLSKVLAALAAKNIGGGINYVAVCQALEVGPAAVAAGLTVDNVMALAYFPLCDVLGRDLPDPGGSREKDAARGPPEQEPIDAAGLSTAVAAAFVIVAAADRLAPGASIVASTALTVLLATALPSVLGPLDKAGSLLGTVLLYLFFATAGAAGGGLAATLVGLGPPLLLFLGALYAGHLAVVFGGARLWQKMTRSDAPDRQTVLAASNANIGGPATAGALCMGKGWQGLVAPALLVGNFGYMVANFVALGLYSVWRGWF